MDHRFNSAACSLLAALTGMPRERVGAVVLRPSRRNWFRMPWYRAPGGAFVLGERIYITNALFDATVQGGREDLLRWLLLMAHELGHVKQAWRIGGERPSRLRFVLWAALNYLGSFLRNGRHAHRNATFEREAEQGRQRLIDLLARTGGCHVQHPVLAIIQQNDRPAMERWLATHMRPIRAA